jgi:3-dehydro-L-gulonate 2-dehydrogenase
MKDKTVYIPERDMRSEFVRILTANGFSLPRAEECADIFVINSLEGIYSHGVNRFPRFVKNIKSGYVRPESVPSLIKSSGAIENWDGNLGPGPLNASFATYRSTELADTYGMGMVALANTNHWMRGGTYGWQAARKGFIFIGWTNTEANMPAWGGKDSRLGNNPLVIGIPFKDEAVILDFAMTQYSYGKLESYSLGKKPLPYPGGFNSSGELSINPDEILETMRALPVGYWKGSGLSLLLDILASVLSGGLSVHEISEKDAEYALSQIFITISPYKFANKDMVDSIILNILDDLKKSKPAEEGNEVRYPGENILKAREINKKRGIPVNAAIWDSVLSL